jgi:hypothetical protein
MCRIGVGLVFFHAASATNGEKGNSLMGGSLCLKEAALAAVIDALDMALVTSTLFAEQLLLIRQVDVLPLRMVKKKRHQSIVFLRTLVMEVKAHPQRKYKI